jgi:hypothetical protein
MQGADGTALRVCGVQRLRLLQRFGVDGDHRVDLWPSPVVGLDPGKVGLYEPLRGEALRLELGVHVFDRRVHELERLLPRLDRRWP